MTVRRLALIVGALFVLSTAITAWTVYRDSAEPAHEQALRESGSRSQATVENVFRPRRDDFVQLTVLIVDGDAQGWEVRVSVDSGTELREGDIVEVAYDPDDPGDLVVIGQRSPDRNGLAIGAWVVTAISAGWLVWTWRQERGALRRGVR